MPEKTFVPLSLSFTREEMPMTAGVRILMCVLLGFILK